MATKKPCAGCDECGLPWRDGHAAAWGPMNASILVIGEAPGANEALQGRPFVGKSGATIRNTMMAFGIDPDKDVRWINTVWCRPPKNRVPTAHEIYQCSELVNRELALTQAKVILTLGRTAIDRVLGHENVSKLSSRATWDGYVYPRDLWPESVKLGNVKAIDPEAVYKSGKNAGQPKVSKVDLWTDLKISDNVEYIVGAYHPSAIQRTSFKEIQRLRQAVRITKDILNGEPVYVGPDMSSGWIIHYPNDWPMPKSDPPSLIVDIENDEFNITRVGLCEVDESGRLLKRGSWPWSPALQHLLKSVLGPDTPYRTIVGHNLTYDVAWLQENGIEVYIEKCLDTMLMAQIDEPDLPKGLGSMWRYLPPRVPWKYRGEQVAMGAYYNLDDVETTARVYHVLLNRLMNKGQLALLINVCRASFTIKRMSQFGLGIDVEAVKAWLEQQGETLEELKKEWELLHPGVNWNSPAQLIKLFLKEGILEDTGDVDTGGFSTDSDTMEKLAVKAEDPGHLRSIELVREMRRISKLTSTWGQGFLDKLDEDGTLRPNYLPQAKDEGNLGSAAGRLSSSPNVQNIPESARFAIIPPKPLLGGEIIRDTLMYVDFSAIENRVMFRMAGDLEMLAKMDRGDYDPHTENLRAALASLELLWREQTDRTWHTNREYYRKQLQIHEGFMHAGGDIRHHPIVDRRMIKTFLYAYTYGSGDTNIAESLGLKLAEAAAIRQGYENAHPLVTKWRDSVIATARSKKMLQNPFGRIRYFWGIVGDSHIRNSAINFLPQSTVADIFWILFPEVEREIGQFNARLMTQVHDAFLLALPGEHVQDCAKVLRMTMEREWPQIAPGFHVPVSIEVGKNWGSMVPVEEWKP